MPLLLMRALPFLLASGAGVALDEAELSRHRERLKEKWELQFRAADADEDRRLSRHEIEAAELPESLARHFDEIDVDGDKGLSPQELWTVHEKRLQAQRRSSGPPR
jgi:Ca2+-binding EF-hand superfamily protein